MLLSHYFQPDSPVEIREAALDDWVVTLIEFPGSVIDRACEGYIRDQPRRRPTPAEIRAKCAAVDARANGGPQRGDRSRLGPDELDTLENRTLPQARRWLDIPGLAEHGRATLQYWGEPVT